MVLLKGWAASLPPSLWDCPDCELGKVHNFPKIFVGVGEGGEGREEGLVCERGGILVSVCVSMSLICIGTELVCLCWARLEASSELLGLNPSPLSGRRGLSLSLKLMDLAWFFWETSSRDWWVSVAIPSPQVTDVTPWGCCGRELRPSWLSPLWCSPSRRKLSVCTPKSRGCSGSVCSFVPFWCWNKPGDSYDAENLICLIKRELGEVLMAWSHGNRLHSLAERPVDRHFCFCFWKLRWWTPLWGCLPWQWAGSLVNPQGSRAAPQPGSSLTELSPCWESGSFLITRGK